MSRGTIIAGTILGLIMPVVGVFMGLQVSTVLGTILAFPFVAVVYVTGTPFGMWDLHVWLLGFGISITIWIGVISILRKLFR